MYASINKTNILLWCDTCSNKSLPVESDVNQLGNKSRKRKSTLAAASHASRVLSSKADIDETVTELQEVHGANYSLPQLRLWARMLAAGHHDSLTDPPNVPAISRITPKRKNSSNVAEMVAAVVSAMRTPEVTQTLTQSGNNIVISSPSTPPHSHTSGSKPSSASAVGHSPGRINDLRMRNLNELCELQELLEQSILTHEEFIEQKSIVLGAMRKLIQ